MKLGVAVAAAAVIGWRLARRRPVVPAVDLYLADGTVVELAPDAPEAARLTSLADRIIDPSG